MLAVHWRSIPKQLQLPDLQPSIMLVDKPGAILGSANILVCLGLLAAAPALKWELWVVTLACALLHALYNFIAYVGYKGRWCKAAGGQQGQQPRDDCAASARGEEAAGGEVAMGAEGGGEQQQAKGTVELVEHKNVPRESVVQQQQSSKQQQQQQQEPGCRRQPSLGTASAVGAGAGGALQPQLLSAPSARGSEADAEVSIHDPELQLRSRANSRVQLLSAQQHAACSDSAGLRHSTSKPEGFCAVALHEHDGDSHKAKAASMDGSDILQAEAAVSSSSSRQGLQPPPVPTFWKAFVVLPWEIVPFVLGMFCVVEGLNANGWVDSLAAWLAGGLGGSVWRALFGVGALSLVLANIINNQVGAKVGFGLAVSCCWVFLCCWVFF